jgi:hypothetical protein
MRSSLRFVVPFVILIAAAASGCATPAPLVSLVPRSPNDIAWAAGRAVLSKETASVRVAVAFEEQDGRDLNLRVEIANDTEVAFDVGPDDVTYSICPTDDDETCVGFYAVTDPEAVLGALDAQQSRARADATNSANLNTSLVLLSAVTDVASIGSGHARRTTGVRTVALAEEGHAEAAQAGATLSTLADQREQWANIALRRSTLQPGRGAAGIVVIPIDLKARYLWLHVRAGGQVFPFGFKQIVRRVDVRGVSHRT